MKNEIEGFDELNNKVLICLPPSHSLVLNGIGGVFDRKLIPTKLPEHIKKIEPTDPRFEMGYRFDVAMKYLGEQQLDEIFHASISNYKREKKSHTESEQ